MLLNAMAAPEMDGFRAIPYAGSKAPAARQRPHWSISLCLCPCLSSETAARHFSQATPAIGMPIALYAKAHTKFCLILRRVTRPKITASTTCDTDQPMTADAKLHRLPSGCRIVRHSPWDVLKQY